MPLTSIVDPRTISSGTFGPSPARSIAASTSARTLIIQFTSNDWDTGEAGLIVNYMLEVSTNAGASWVVGDKASFLGGARNSRTGLMPASTIPLAANIAVQIRGTVTLNQQANSLGLSFDVF